MKETSRVLPPIAYSHDCVKSKCKTVFELEGIPGEDARKGSCPVCGLEIRKNSKTGAEVVITPGQVTHR